MELKNPRSIFATTFGSLASIFVAAAFLFFHADKYNVAYADEITNDLSENMDKKNSPPLDGISNSVGIKARMFGDIESILALSVLVLAALFLSFAAYLVVHNSYDASETMKIITVPLIIVGTLFLITTGYSDSQIAPAMGLFGTIAGYLLGRSSV